MVGNKNDWGLEFHKVSWKEEKLGERQRGKQLSDNCKYKSKDYQSLVKMWYYMREMPPKK